MAGAAGARDRNWNRGRYRRTVGEQRAGSRGTVRPCFFLGLPGKAPSTHGVDLLTLGLSPVGGPAKQTAPHCGAVCLQRCRHPTGPEQGGIQMFLSDIDVELFAAARVVFVTL
ncbi:hypothetical protein SM139_3490 [Stenotrophomonas maltophilia]|nr:hypothetical protein SM139_3490 [Stenotrophomonas maltophilia]